MKFEMTGMSAQASTASTAMSASESHSLLCTVTSTLSGSLAIPASLPSHFAQNMKVAAEPNASMRMSAI